jgi:predicted permease
MMAVWGRSVLAVAVPPAVVPPDSIQVDATVLAFAVLVATASGLVCSLLPAFAATRVDLRDVLSAGSRTLAGGHRTMRAFVTVQVALACALLASAALFARSLAHLDGVDPGFQSEGVSYASFSIGGAPGSSYAEPSARVRFFRSLLERLGESPGVVSVGVTTHLPFGFSPNGQVQIEGRGSEPVGGVHFRLVGGAFFETLSIPLRSGRLFDARDTDGRSRVALVNERAARALWRDESPVGDRIRMPGMDGDANWFTIVGVVADIRHRGLAREPVPEAFFPFEQRPMRTWGMQLVARVDDSASAFGADLQEVVSAIDPRVPASAQPLDTLVEAQVRPSRFRATLLAAFGATAVVLSMVGIFGVMSYFVTRRTREVGLRMALGADRRDVRRMVLGRALIPVWIGIAAGAALSLGAGRLVEALLPGISPRDPIALGGSAAIIAATAVLAAWWPAWRASRVDPVTALRES